MDEALRADMKLLAEKLVTPEAKERMSKLSPEDRAKVIEVTSRIIASYLSKRAKQHRTQ